MSDRSDGTVVLVGTMDTKGSEYRFIQDKLQASGLSTIVVDTGVLGHPTIDVEVTREQVAAAADASLDDLVNRNDRGRAVDTMARGAERVIADLHRQHKFDGALALGGTGGTSIAAQALQSLPIGVPKVIVSTVASGNTSPYIGSSDLVLFPSVVDIAGVNRISSVILGNAAHALAGMVATRRATTSTHEPSLPAIAASMFGVTTPCVDAARRHLDEQGYEVLVFHMTGVGGRSLERLISEHLVNGVLDVTTTELADELVGGVFSAGPDRLTAAARTGTPQVVSVGALDMVNFGPQDTVPAEFRHRRLLVHNPTVTLMRTTPEECAELGARLAQRVSASTGPATVVLPLRGVSAVSIAGGPFHWPDADQALFDAVRDNLDRTRLDLVELDTDINDPTFAQTASDILNHYVPANT